MAHFNLDEYETVEVRIEKFWKKYPDGRIETILVQNENNEFIILASIYASRDSDENAIATGYAHEVVGQGMVNKTSALENCETSAIGRALANAGFATKGKRPSREEMNKVARSSQAKVSKETAVDAMALVGKIADITNLDDLKLLWSENADVLDVKVGKTTVRELILARKDSINESAKNEQNDLAE